MVEESALHQGFRMIQTPDIQIRVEDDRTGLSPETLKRAFLDNLFYIQGKYPRLATQNDYYMALAYTVRDRLLQRWLGTTATYLDRHERTVCYFSAEFLMGPHLGNNLINLEIEDPVKAAIADLCIDFEKLLEQEEEPGLGNGGLGRLAACYLESLATQEIPAIGFGIRYEYGIFDQCIQDGWQVEITDKWLRYGNPWEVPRPEWAVGVPFGGRTELFRDEHGHDHSRWIPTRVVKGVPYDTPIVGYRNNTANTLRLWKAEAAESFSFGAFNEGDYYGAVQDKVVSETLTKVLYPNDEKVAGKQLRLEQQFFFVSCSLQHLINIPLGQNLPVEQFHEKFVIQLNDTHPAIAIAELMRLLMDEHGVDWQIAWSITQQTFAYTNHTLLPEALEKWPLAMFQSLLPRHLEIIYDLNAHFLDEVRLRFPGDNDRLARLSLIDEGGERYVRMAHLACVGSHAINGVAELHSNLLKDTVLHDFYALFPEKFTNVTNGVTPRRWLVLSNPRLTHLICDRIGEGWIKNLEDLRQLEPAAEDAAFRAQWRGVKQTIKQDLATYLDQLIGIQVDPRSLFDIQVKRIHEYKRQHLNILHVATLYFRLKANPQLEMTPRTVMFGGKAAPSYRMAKLMIKLINAIGEVVNRDPVTRDRLRVVFIPDFNVKVGQRIYPAADLSEQISTAGMEASGTGNMKFAMNGALTIGTLDGANIEIREEVGAENFFLFGLSAQEVQALKSNGYRPEAFYQANETLKAVLDFIADGYFSHGDRDLFRPLVDQLKLNDPFLVLADYQSYVDCQDQIAQVYRDPELWSRMSILNTARMGKFSSDRAIQEYCEEIWKIKSVPIDLAAYPFDAGSCQL
jgi:glycogen phosphorylase